MEITFSCKHFFIKWIVKEDLLIKYYKDSIWDFSINLSKQSICCKLNNKFSLSLKIQQKCRYGVLKNK